MYARLRPAPFYAFAHVDPTRTEGWERYRRRRVIFATLVTGKVTKKSAHDKNEFKRLHVQFSGSAAFCENDVKILQASFYAS